MVDIPAHRQDCDTISARDPHRPVAGPFEKKQKLKKLDKEKLSKWSSIAEILSSIAVLVTLVFLVIEFRQNNALIEQNNRAIRDAAIQSLDEGVLTIVNMLAAEEKNAVLFSKGVSDFENLSNDQKIHFRALINAVCLRMDVSWYAYQNGLLPEPLWRREERVLTELVNSPGGRTAWSSCNASHEFLDYVEENLISAK